MTRHSFQKPGAVIDDEFPYIVWVCMLKRPPGTISAVEANNVFALRGKFNSILEERLLDGSDEKHRIMSIDIRMDEFDLQGNLNPMGKIDFWREVDRAMQKFDTGDIKLKPRCNWNAQIPKKEHNNNSSSFISKIMQQHHILSKKQDSHKNHRSPLHLKLKTPPPRRRDHSHHRHASPRKRHTHGHDRSSRDRDSNRRKHYY